MIRWLAVGGTVAVLLLTWSITRQHAPYAKPLPIKTSSYVAPPLPKPAVQALAARLKIPKIQVDTAVESVGLTPTGEMATTTDPATVAWYKLGQRPGEVGSAVIAGHFGWKNNIPAAFDRLNKLQIGDSIYTQDAAGVTTGFTVRNIRIFGKNDSADSVFKANDGNAHLNLITCEGTWSSASHSYSNRLVVFSDKQ